MTEARKTSMVAKTVTAAATKQKAAAAPAKPAVEKIAKAAAKVEAKPRKIGPAKAVKPQPDTQSAKPKKPKLVRDSFTIPKVEYAVLDELKQRAAKLGYPAKKSELLRAGIKALAAMDAASFAAALHNVPAIKTGRPKNS